VSSGLNVISQTQHIIVDPFSSAVAVINAGPQGPGGPIGQVSTAAMNQAIATAIAGVHQIPPGGTPGQVLGKLSANDYDVGWVTPT
jgi:hypothetical protein